VIARVSYNVSVSTRCVIPSTEERRLRHALVSPRGRPFAMAERGTKADELKPHTEQHWRAATFDGRRRSTASDYRSDWRC